MYARNPSGVCDQLGVGSHCGVNIKRLIKTFRGLEMAPGHSPPLREMQEAGIPGLKGSCTCF